MTKYERLLGLKPRGVRTTDDAWGRLKAWCKRLKVTLEEGLDQLLMGLDDYEGGFDDRKPAKVARPAPNISGSSGRFPGHEFPDEAEGVTPEVQAWIDSTVKTPEEVENARRTVEQQPAPVSSRGPVAEEERRDVVLPADAAVGGRAVSVEPGLAPAEVGWGASSGYAGLGAEVEDEPKKLRLNTKKLDLGLDDGKYELPLWKEGDVWVDDGGQRLAPPFAKILDKFVKEGKMELEVGEQ